jgi:transcriptional regulator with GAF, ATPase, and Fis domain
MSDSEPPYEETRRAPVALAPTFRSQPRVVWTESGAERTRVIEGRVLLGSAPSSAIVVADPTVSRVHAEFEARQDGVWVRDLGSRNGTFVDGLQVKEARVPDKGRVRLGATDFVMDYNLGRRRPIEIWPNDTFGKLVGTSVAMRELFATLARIAPMDASVLIQGETGTGKELVARAIHDASPRASRPFVVVDCAALPENLLDAELFGHTKGAFTGAVGARTGAIEAADGGSVFLDEIGELPPAMQPKLLRVLESRTVRRVGETTHRTVDVRFISATHRDLLTMVNASEFREDLYFRLSVIPVDVPPLRDRQEDIELLVNHFLSGSGSDGPASPDLVRELMNRPWRGNVRELRNFVDRARALGSNAALAISQRAAGEDGNRPSRFDDSKIFETNYKDFRETWVDEGEKEYIRRLLLRHNRNVAAAAREAEVDRTYIYRLIRKHEL